MKRIGLKNILAAGLFAALAATVSVGYGDDVDGHRGNCCKGLEPSVGRLCHRKSFSSLAPAGCTGFVTPADSVTVFATLDGVELVDPENVDEFSDPEVPADRLCLTPNGLVPLWTVLSNFANLGGEVVVCPLCWVTRVVDPELTEPTYGIIGNAFDIHALFLYADKVITF